MSTVIKHELKPKTKLKNTKHHVVPRAKRNRSGCLCCRKRKIKCDENKPNCHGCIRNNYVCVWPTEGQALPHSNDFKLQKVEHNEIVFIYGKNARDSLRKQHQEKYRIQKQEFELKHKEPASSDTQLKTTLISPQSYQDYNTSTIVKEEDIIPEIDNELVSHSLSPITQCSQLQVSSVGPNTLVFADQHSQQQIDLTDNADYISQNVPESLVVEIDMNEKELDDDALFRKYLESLTRSFRVSNVLNGYSTWILGVDLTEEDAFFYDVFVKAFMVAVSPQFAHQNLQPGAIFIPPGTRNPILRNVFYACGAAYLCWRRDEMKRVAEIKYQYALDMLSTFLETNDIAGNEHWLLVAVLCLCLRERYHGEDITKHTIHMTTALEIIKCWQANKMKQMGLSTKKIRRLSVDADYGVTVVKPTKRLMDTDELPLDSEFDSYDYSEEYSIHDIFKRERNALEEENEMYNQYVMNERSRNAMVFNKLLNRLAPRGPSPFDYLSENEFDDENEGESILKEIEDADCARLETAGIEDISSAFHRGYVIDPCERTLLESFVYNYSISLLTCDKTVVTFLSSPFQVFKEFKQFLCQPIYNCPAPWMNNPVMGAALPAFELAAKSNWLSLQHPLSETNKKIAIGLLKTAKYYVTPFLPPEVKSTQPVHVQKKLMESCYEGGMVARASFIFLTKMINPTMDQSNLEIQNTVDLFIKDLEKLSLHSQESVISTWPLAVAGTAVIKKEQQDYIITRINKFTEVFKMECFVTVINFLKLVWGTEKNPGPGWDALINREYLKHLFV